MKQTVIFVHVLAIYILPFIELAKNTEKSTVERQYLLQRRGYAMGTTWLHFKQKRQRRTGFSST